jgi:dTDP-4-amino-4,6-dideoxygalactose transaminase
VWKVQLFKLNFDDRETDAAAGVVRNAWLPMGDQVAAFESSFAHLLQVPAQSCAAVSSCTAALHMAVLALALEPGDEVIVPALTFIADANVVRIAGARPVLADCTSTVDCNVSTESIARSITGRTKAVMVLHYAGYPCDMGPIARLCKESGIALIEDVAHAPGAMIDGQACGTFGDVACFSFFSNKNLSMGEGGLLATRNPVLHERIRGLRSHGMTSLTFDRHKGRAVSYDVTMPGLNYRLDEIRAAIGLVQLEKLPAANARRKELTDRYRARLAGSKATIPFASLRPGVVPAYHILPTLLPEHCDRLLVISRLKEKGVQSSIHYPPFWEFTAYKGMFDPADVPVAAEICRRELTLPLFPTLTDDEVDYVCDTYLEAIA